MADKEISIRVGKLYSKGLDYDDAQKEFLSHASDKEKSLLENQFDEVWNEYEHMYLSTLSFMSNK